MAFSSGIRLGPEKRPARASAPGARSGRLALPSRTTVSRLTQTSELTSRRVAADPAARNDVLLGGPGAVILHFRYSTKITILGSYVRTGPSNPHPGHTPQVTTWARTCQRAQDSLGREAPIGSICTAQNLNSGILP